MTRTVQNKKGFSLLEVSLALGLGSLILVAATTAFRLSYHNWRKNNQRSELTEHVRLAMDRMMTELKYSEGLVQATSVTHSYLEFNTTNLVDSDPGTERIFFYRLNGNEAIYRTIDGASPAPQLAGIPFEYPRVSSMIITPLKVDGSNNLVPLVIPPDALSDAVAVKVDLTMIDYENHPLTVSSIAKMRNRP